MFSHSRDSRGELEAVAWVCLPPGFLSWKLGSYMEMLRNSGTFKTQGLVVAARLTPPHSLAYSLAMWTLSRTCCPHDAICHDVTQPRVPSPKATEWFLLPDLVCSAKLWTKYTSYLCEYPASGILLQSWKTVWQNGDHWFSSFWWHQGPPTSLLCS